MRLDSKYYSFCREIGLMKENFSQQGALDSIIREVSNSPAADPKFVELVKKLTLNSPEVSIRVCVLYSYTAEVDYVVGGNIKTTTVQDFGYSGVPNQLCITQYKGDGDYRTLQDVSSIPYSIYNDDNLFTFEQMKNALTKAVEEHLPKNTTSFKSRDWSVSAYFVPVLNVSMNYGGKHYYMNYNLQNGHYHWDYPDNPALIQKGLKARTYSFFAKAGGLIFSLISVLMVLSSFDFLRFAIALGATIANLAIIKKTKKSKEFCKKIFIKDPKKSMAKAIAPAIWCLILGFASMMLIILGGGA